MRVLRVALTALAAVAVLVALSASSALAGQRTVYTGQWLCDDRGSISPLTGMKVELWKRGEDWLPVEITGGAVDRGYTDSDGRFRLTSPRDEDDYFVRMALRDAHGVYLKDFWGINDWSIDSAQRPNNRAVRNLGGLLLKTPNEKSHKCAIWAGVHNAYEEYRRDVGSALPSRGVEIQADAVTAGVPFTPHTSIWWPSDFPVGYAGGGDDSITRHEFGHVIRHGFDGDLGHFLGDVIDHNYLQNHEACNKTGLGFAFNEGWAEYWARDFWPAPDCGRPGDFETEGNVAAALTALEHNCAGDQRRIMVDVLRRNPGTIHSYAEFAAKLGCPIPLPTPVLVIAASATAPVAIQISDAKRAALARGDVRGTMRNIRGLKVMLRKSTQRAVNVPRCIRRCLSDLRRLTRPAGLQLELALARIHLGSVKNFDSKKEQRRLRGSKVAKLVNWHKRQQRRAVRKALSAARRAVQRVLAQGRRIFKTDRSKATKQLRGALARAKARLGRAAKKPGGLLPAVLTISPGKVQPLRKTRIRKFPPPPPLPGPNFVPIPPPPPQPADSTLKITSCPAEVVRPKPIEVSGSLTPAQANTTVKVNFKYIQEPEPEVQSVKTDANGNWMASFSPANGFDGEWTVQAEFAGDATRKPSTSSTCTTQYEPEP